MSRRLTREAGEKTVKNARRTCNASGVAARLRLTRRRERRLLTLIEAGATISEASRAVGISRMTVYRRTRADAAFANRLRLARVLVRVPGPPVDDWRALALILESNFPERLVILTRAVERGEIPPQSDPQAVIEQLVAPAYFRALVTKQPLDARLTETSVERALTLARG